MDTLVVLKILHFVFIHVKPVLSEMLQLYSEPAVEKNCKHISKWQEDQERIKKGRKIHDYFHVSRFLSRDSYGMWHWEWASANVDECNADDLYSVNFATSARRASL